MARRKAFRISGHMCPLHSDDQCSISPHEITFPRDHIDQFSAPRGLVLPDAFEGRMPQNPVAGPVVNLTATTIQGSSQEAPRLYSRGTATNGATATMRGVLTASTSSTLPL